jgi:hypothetical protein
MLALGMGLGWLAVARAADEGVPDRFDTDLHSHWAFQPVTRPAVPAVHKADRARNAIDAFVLAKLEAHGLELSAPADKSTLLRRVCLDLTGLPPSSEEVQAFLADVSPGAFETVVDRLLASPHYGERWARHWLDLARYAESEGFKADETRPNAWRYRDYVIRALNSDKPYDRFVREQIAGDELWPDDPDALVATAFNRHYPDESNARNLRQRRQEILNDITDTVGSTFTGLSYACARCHDHKYEPIRQADYYRLQAFFANTAARDDIPLVRPEEQQRHREQLARWEESTRAIRAEIDRMAAPHRRAIETDYFEKYPDDIRAILEKPEGDRNPLERQMAWKARQYLDPKSHEYVGDDDAVAGRLKGEMKKRWQELQNELKQFQHPGEMPVGTGMTDLGREAPATYVLHRGFHDKPKEEVQPGFLPVIHTVRKASPASSTPSTSGRRSVLAEILTDPANPLPARVIVNRLWFHHFGQGIVGSPSDFGVKGERPTHPELLDWLASEFVAHGWSLKYLHRLMVTSATYRQSSAWQDAAGRADPGNKLLWRYPRHRLEGEVIRDVNLAVSGLLNLKMGGPSVFPELPAGMPTPRGGWTVNRDAEERNRRSVYVFVRRNTRYPMFDSFDMPDPHESCPRRNVTTSPLQALTLLNGQLSLGWAQSFAGRVLEMAPDGVEQQIGMAYVMAYARSPGVEERTAAREFFRRQRAILAERAVGGEGLALPPLLSAESDVLHAATLVDFCHALLNANEFVYVN